MSPEKQRITIAEILGYDNVNPKCWRAHKNGVEVVVPTWDSLDAMHEAAMTLKDRELRNNYINHLDQIIYPLLEDEDDDVEREFLWCEATTAQRREAFLKTFNRWES